MIALIYNTNIISTVNNKDDLELILNRPMFKNMINDQIQNLYIENTDKLNIDKYLYRLIVIGKDIIITNIEYIILRSLYNDSDNINNKYSLYQYIFTHPIFNISYIDEYIRYRDKLYRLSELNREYDSIMNTLL
jgi:hypothetical protein